jgi:hypothetical protein
MTVRRGDALGIELHADRVVAVRLSADAPGRLAGAAEAHCDHDFDNSVSAAIERVVDELGSRNEQLPVRLTAFADDDALQAIDITSASEAEVRAIVAGSVEATAYSLIQQRSRRWAVFAATPPQLIARLRRGAAAAGFSDIEWEPSPMAAARTLSTSALIGRATANGSWAALTSDGIPFAAAGGVGWPAGDGLPILCAAREMLHVDPRALDNVFVRDALHDIVADHCRSAERVPPEPQVLGDPYPPFSDDHPLALSRAGVAVGAAVAAAGLLSHRQRWTMAAVSADDDDRPWAVQRLADVASHEPAPAALRRNWLRRTRSAGNDG